MDNKLSIHFSDDKKKNFFLLNEKPIKTKYIIRITL